MRKITENEYSRIIGFYHNWKELNYGIKEFANRGVNLHEYISEGIVSYHYDFYINNEKGADSADCYDNDNNKVQVKGSSTYDSDLSSFGPDSEFDRLFYLGLDVKSDTCYIWEVDASLLDTTYVNKTETFRDQQKAGKRPRFSIYDKYIRPNNLMPEKTISLKK